MIVDKRGMRRGVSNNIDFGRIEAMIARVTRRADRREQNGRGEGK